MDVRTKHRKYLSSNGRSFEDQEEKDEQGNQGPISFSSS